MEPVTRYNGFAREVIKEQYVHRLRQDRFFYDFEKKKFNKQTVIDYGNAVFLNENEIVDLTADPQPNELTGKSWLGSLPNFVVLGEKETKFYLKCKPHNGMRSFVRGYYKILPIPRVRFKYISKIEDGKNVVNHIENWETDVLYCEGPSDTTIYKYNCNVGPLVNSLAIRYNWQLKELFSYNRPINKNNFLKGLINSTFYVSSAELVNYKDFNTVEKEVLWFCW